MTGMAVAGGALSVVSLDQSRIPYFTPLPVLGSAI